MTISVSMRVNGEPVTAEVEPRTLLVQLLREQLRLTGTHVGCDTSQCGACVVHLDGRSVKSCAVLAWRADGADVTTIEGVAVDGELSCAVLAWRADGADVTTIEGVAVDGELHPMQAAFREHHALQCGFCTPGMIMSALDLVKHNPDPSEQEVRDWLEGNLCRCTGYHNIVVAIRAGARAMGG